MREIKFRGLAVDKSEWRYGLLSKDMEGSTAYYNEYPYRLVWHEGTAFLNQPVITETIGQYTGLKDKNGIEIYEGDICIGIYGDEKYQNEVFFTSGSFALRHNNDNFGCCASLDEHESVEVIGNIHDNPELLEEK